MRSILENDLLSDVSARIPLGSKIAAYFGVFVPAHRKMEHSALSSWKCSGSFVENDLLSDFLAGIRLGSKIAAYFGVFKPAHRKK